MKKGNKIKYFWIKKGCRIIEEGTKKVNRTMMKNSFHHSIGKMFTWLVAN
ncbi:MAG: hypothetical protein JKX68_13825 [Flavobacteriales bacterium]|nr:hypothetical protein [Flavobacteriales bacterium]